LRANAKAGFRRDKTRAPLKITVGGTIALGMPISVSERIAVRQTLAQASKNR
jgi:hypothetical protein